MKKTLCALTAACATLAFAAPARAQLSNDDLVTACFGGRSVAAAHVSDFPHDVLTRWIGLHIELAKETRGFTPPVMSRAFGYISAALYQALLPGMPSRRPLNDFLKDDIYFPDTIADVEYNWAVVANAALATATQEILADSPRDKDNFADIGRLYADIAEPYRTKISDRIYRHSARYGRNVALAVYAASMQDGGFEAHLHNYPSEYRPPKGKGKWRPITQYVFPALQPYWGDKRTFFLNPAQNDCAARPPEYSEDKNSPFYADAMETYEFATAPATEERAAALFWSGDPRHLANPPARLMASLAEALKRKNATLEFAADAFMRVGLTIADAEVFCRRAQYRENVMRPITYIRDFIAPGWNDTPALTPPSPEFPSCRAMQAGAALPVLEAMFGKGFGFTDESQEYLGLPPRRFASLADMAKEMAFSGLYAGVNYRTTAGRSFEAGKCLGAKAADMLK